MTNAFGGRAPPGPAGGASALPQGPLAAIGRGVLLLMGRWGRGGEGRGKGRGRDKLKGKVFPYSLPSVGPGADPGVQAVSPQVT